jgi:hypothetical protein
MRHRPPWPYESRWWVVWMIFCAVVGLIVTAVGVWAVVVLVTFITR